MAIYAEFHMLVSAHTEFILAVHLIKSLAYLYGIITEFIITVMC